MNLSERNLRSLKLVFDLLDSDEDGVLDKEVRE